jgi:5-methylcytosine-specific restriction endonuclease McrA
MNILNPNNVVPVKYAEGISGKDKTKKECNKLYIIKLTLKFKNIKKENRLLFLKSKLKTEDNPISINEMTNKRKGFNFLKGIVFPLGENTKCYVCGLKAKIRHHVVPLSKGGRNKRSNIVPLCHRCHCAVHPHMQKKSKPFVPHAAPYRSLYVNPR